MTPCAVCWCAARATTSVRQPQHGKHNTHTRRTHRVAMRTPVAPGMDAELAVWRVMVRAGPVPALACVACTGTRRLSHQNCKRSNNVAVALTERWTTKPNTAMHVVRHLGVNTALASARTHLCRTAAVCIGGFDAVLAWQLSTPCYKQLRGSAGVVTPTVSTIHLGSNHVHGCPA